MKELIDTEELCRRFDIDPGFVAHWTEDQDHPLPYLTVGGLRRFDPAAVTRWFDGTPLVSDPRGGK